ncbi:tRNA (N6-threonylcarbamoyladenosine(37)-N6)-methyltransferase TrmO [Fervidicoccus fontis]|uniref:TsaA-like domain-containing protein n=1 Tax=Fervidicoccus fontis (strain DSM 19380 / JCM 18336 / VKM B-2539 / Kam940) TaxID=1163730 RepID=H9ZZ76_FERFK|nr:tRNA (N6-threonylcarbamoyladenosine(37)-N6)-methyltransferase TrmO [Fervidicoccus fontis]AFH42033.1 hypothetical protein FFONT_0037 [Fervidicoccus fontis Kam940]
MEEICLKPIGFVRHEKDEELRRRWEGVEGEIEILPEYEEGLKGIEGFSHIILIAYLHLVEGEKRRVLKVKPRRLRNFGISIDDLPEVGVFSSDSPHRPNPIAISIVKLKGVQGRVLEVEGLDLYSGTPILDIKPYGYERRIEEIRVPWWSDEVKRRVEEKMGREKKRGKADESPDLHP